MARNTVEAFKDKLAKTAPDWKLTGEYHGVRSKTLFRHSICGKEFVKSPQSVLYHPTQCSECGKKKLSLSPAEYAKQVEKKDYTLLVGYKNSNTRIKVRHEKCGTEFWTMPLVYRRSEEGCPRCKSKFISRQTRMTHEQFVQKLGERADEYEFLTRYEKARTPIKVKHLPCGNEFDIIPDNMLRGSRCKKCKYSTGEGEVYRFLKAALPNGTEIIQGDRTHLSNRREIDIWVPEFNIGIEYDGLAYHTVEHLMADTHRGWSEATAASYHLWKTKECEKQGIWLVHIFEDEWMEHREIVEDKLRAAFRCQMKKYYARNLTIKEVGCDERTKFLNENHIQGKSRASVAVGLYRKKELLAVQSFFDEGDGGWELNRYATKLGTRVIGGFTKCLTYFVKKYSPKRVKSFGDRRWCSPFTDVYRSTGFRLDGVNRPNYWYVKGRNRWHKSNFRKEKIAKMGIDITGKTEKELMRALGYQRIYDCGMFRYILEF